MYWDSQLGHKNAAMILTCSMGLDVQQTSAGSMDMDTQHVLGHVNARTSLSLESGALVM
jgi:hypothetical protein